MVTLDPKTHTYKDAKGVEYFSVTRFINKFVPEFDFENKSKQYASKYGLDVEEVRESWKQKNKQSTDFGTLIHEQIENKLLSKETTESKFDFVVDAIVERVKKDFNDGKFLLEHAVWDVDKRIAGTSDLIVEHKNSFNIIDFKTNKQIKYTNDYSEKFLLKPIDHLPNGEYFKYALQLSFYAFLYKKLTDKMPHRLCFYWLKRKNNSYEDMSSSKWLRYNVPYLEEEVITLLEYGR